MLNTQIQCYVRALSFGFASPEQYSGEPLSTLSDVFSLGKVLEQAISGLLLNKLQRRELSAIINKATANSPAKRYQGCMQLSADLNAMLHNRAVSVLPPSIYYRLHKFIARQPAWSVAAAVMITMLTSVAASHIYQYQQLQKETHTKTTVVNFLKELFKATDLAFVEGAPLTLPQLLEKGSQMLLRDPHEFDHSISSFPV